MKGDLSGYDNLSPMKLRMSQNDTSTAGMNNQAKELKEEKAKEPLQDAGEGKPEEAGK